MLHEFGETINRGSAKRSLCYRRTVLGARFSRKSRSPHMARCSELEGCALHRAKEQGHHRRRAELDALEGAMPGARMRDPGRDVALAQLGEIEPGAEMLALAVDDNGFDVVRCGGEEMLDPLNSHVVERVALV